MVIGVIQMKPPPISLSVLAFPLPAALWATVFGSVRGMVHDPDHLPVPGAAAVLEASSSGHSQTVLAGSAGAFEPASLPAGACPVTVKRDGFAPSRQHVVAVSGTVPWLHFRLVIGPFQQTVAIRKHLSAAVSSGRI